MADAPRTNNQIREAADRADAQARGKKRYSDQIVPPSEKAKVNAARADAPKIVEPVVEVVEAPVAVVEVEPAPVRKRKSK